MFEGFLFYNIHILVCSHRCLFVCGF